MNISLLFKSLIYIRETANELLATSDLGGNDLFRLKREIEQLQLKLPEFEGITEGLAEEVLSLSVNIDKTQMEDHRSFFSTMIYSCLRILGIFEERNREEVARRIEDVRNQIDHIIYKY